ncbi:MAG: patatin-like phospholipase family protein [Steroidobacteraceae bacterium]
MTAAVLAAEAHRWPAGPRALEQVGGIRRGQGVPRRRDRHAARRPALVPVGGLRGLLLPAPRSLFDNSPLRRLLEQSVDFEALRANVAHGTLQAVAFSATTYVEGRNTAFFAGVPELAERQRAARCGRRAQLDLDHLMASAAIPFLFPAVRLGGEYYGDGAMRQLAPLSPAIHLGAERLLVIGVRPIGAGGMGALLAAGAHHRPASCSASCSTRSSATSSRRTSSRPSGSTVWPRPCPATRQACARCARC